MATIARDVIIVSIEKLSTIFVSWIIYPLAASPRWKNRPADQGTHNCARGITSAAPYRGAAGPHRRCRQARSGSLTKMEEARRMAERLRSANQNAWKDMQAE